MGQEKSKPVRHAWFALRIVIGIVLLGLVIRMVDYNAVVESLSAAHVVPLLALCLVQVFDRVLMAFKWNILLRPYNACLTLGEATRLQYIGSLAGAFTPGGLGTDAYRIAALMPLGKTDIVVSSIIIERFIGLAAVGAIAAAFLPLSIQYAFPELKDVVWWIVSVPLIAFGAVLISLRPTWVKPIVQAFPFLSRFRFSARLGQMYDSYAEYRHHPLLLAVFVLLTLFEVFVVVFAYFVAAKALGMNMGLVFFFCIVPIMQILARVPISFHGIGVFEGMLAYFVQASGFSGAAGVSIVLIMRFSEIVAVFLPGVVLTMISPKVVPRRS